MTRRTPAGAGMAPGEAGSIRIAASHDWFCTVVAGSVSGKAAGGPVGDAPQPREQPALHAGGNAGAETAPWPPPLAVTVPSLWSTVPDAEQSQQWSFDNRPPHRSRNRPAGTGKGGGSVW
jgi:hypothetical protein